MSQIALQRSVRDMVDEYDEKSAALPAEIEAFHAAVRRVEMASCVGGSFGGSTFARGAPSVHENDLRRNLLVSAWKAIYGRLQIDRIASADDRRKWERTVSDPPPLTIDNAIATFGDYLVRTRFHILKGLAECFVDLDPAYRSHSKVKIGVAGLPKRVILRGVSRYGSYGRDRLRDLLNALAAYRGENVVEHSEFGELDKLHTFLGHQAGDVTIRGLTVRKYQNGNAHVIFDPVSLRDINRALAEFYGEVLPDVEDRDAKPAQSTAVAKDLQFYWSPPAVIDAVLDDVGVLAREEWNRDRAPRLRVLEPSCGDGRIMDHILGRGHKPFGVEVHAGRAAEASAKGHAVQVANFLECPPAPEFDAVAMNPPFYGQHWRKHVGHALRFLKPGGRLGAILPATAHYDHDVTKVFGGVWRDLPVASFAEAGTNVPTGYLITRVRTA